MHVWDSWEWVEEMWLLCAVCVPPLPSNLILPSCPSVPGMRVVWRMECIWNTKRVDTKLEESQGEVWWRWPHFFGQRFRLWNEFVSELLCPSYLAAILHSNYMADIWSRLLVILSTSLMSVSAYGSYQRQSYSIGGGLHPKVVFPRVAVRSWQCPFLHCPGVCEASGGGWEWDEALYRAILWLLGLRRQMCKPSSQIINLQNIRPPLSMRLNVDACSAVNITAVCPHILDFPVNFKTGA